LDVGLHLSACKDYEFTLTEQGIPVTDEKHLLCARLYTLETPALYKNVNTVLRDALSGDASKRETAKECIISRKHFITHLQNAIYLIPGFQEDTVVYRGQTFIPPNIEEYMAGYEIIWPAFSSCSPDKEICEKFANGKLMYFFSLPKNQGANLQAISYFPSEQEILLPMFTKFKVLSVTRSPEMEWLIELSSPEFPPLIQN